MLLRSLPPSLPCSLSHFLLSAYFFRVQSELQALLKRIDARRKEHIKQRNLDSKRLLQRNRNVQTVLESKQNVEGLKLTEEIKKVRSVCVIVRTPAGVLSFRQAGS